MFTIEINIRNFTAKLLKEKLKKMIKATSKVLVN